MPRKLRLEYPGATYHIINRGNYRANVFASEGAKAAFEACTFEACVRSDWVLHAFVIMRNHYHLALETPTASLVAGMQWLQATFANRFNRLRDERGHLFQGRYKALLVEPTAALGQICDYIHLNPVRAGIVPVARLGEYRHSSYWYLARPRARPPFLRLQTGLTQAGNLPDTPAGWRSYSEYLNWQAAQGPAGKSKAYVHLSEGWALGTADFKTALIKEHRLTAETRAWERTGKDEIREACWADRLQTCLRALGKSQQAAVRDRKAAPWKVAVAAYLKQTTQARNGWLAEHLHMGGPTAVSQYVGQLRRSGGPAASLSQVLIEKLKTFSENPWSSDKA